MMLLIALGLFGASCRFVNADPPSEAANSFPCASFWPGVDLGGILEGESCRAFDGWPQSGRSIGPHGVKFAAAYTDQILPAQVSVIESLLGAIERSISTYALYDRRMPSMVLIATTHPSGPASMSSFHMSSGDLPCMILGRPRWLEDAGRIGPGEDGVVAKRSFAHEIYHCIQSKQLRAVMEAEPQRWLREGSATYFGIVVYPSYDYDPLLRLYRPGLPLYLHSRDLEPYAAGLFFLSLEPRRGRFWIHRFVMTSKPSYTVLEERRRLSNTPTMAEDFHQFAKQFSLALYFPHKGIRDTSGVFVVPDLGIITPPKRAVAHFNPNGSSGTATLSAVPFTIAEFFITIAPGHRVVLSADHVTTKQRVGWRLAHQDHWKPVSKTANLADREDEITAPIFGTRIRLLFTSTEDTDQDTIRIRIHQTVLHESRASSWYRSLPWIGLDFCPAPPV